MSWWRALLLWCLLAGSASAVNAPRAIWTWEPESYRMLEDDAYAGETIAFLKAKQIQTVYLYADAWHGRNLVATHPQLVRKLLRRMRKEGITAHALIGSAYLNTERWVLPQHQHNVLASVQRIVDYNAQAGPDERFTGINLDIEPHILDEWDRDKDQLMLQFLDMGKAIMDKVRASGQRLPVGPAIPFWLDGMQGSWRGARKPISEHVQDVFDYVALMDYRDRALGPDSITSHAANELAYGRKIGRTVMIGIETTPNDIQKVSFDHLTEADMERELALAQQHFGSTPAFGGFVLHHLAGYQRWLKRNAKHP
jgi:hypothetical protein